MMIPGATGCPVAGRMTAGAGTAAAGMAGRRPRPRMRLPRPLRMALPAILCLFALLAAVDLALTIIDPDRPMHVAQLILGPLLRLSGLFTLGM